MARTRFNAPNIGNCSLVYYSDLGGTLSISGPIYFPWSFDPIIYGLTATDLNGTYSFLCNGCTYIVEVDEYSPPVPTPTPSITPTNTITPTITPSITMTATITSTPSITPTSTSTSTVTPTPSVTVTNTNSTTPTPTVSPSIEISTTPTLTPTFTPTTTPTQTPTLTPTQTSTETPTQTSTETPTQTSTETPTQTPTSTPTITPTLTQTSTTTPTPTCPACYEYEISQVGKAGGGEYSMTLCNGTLTSATINVGDTLSTGCVKVGTITLTSGILGDITQGINCGSAC
jgi:hypothetical protein